MILGQLTIYMQNNEFELIPHYIQDQHKVDQRRLWQLKLQNQLKQLVRQKSRQKEKL